MQVHKARHGYKLVKSLYGKYEEIPDEWEYRKLSDLAEKEKDIVAGPFGSNLVVSDYRIEGVPIIRLQNIGRNTFINKNIQFISKEKAEELKYHSYKPDDLVLAKLGDPIGKTCRIPKNFPAGIVVADVVRIRTSETKSDSSFIEYALNSEICERQLNKEKIGTTRPRVNLEQIRNLEFPTPPKQEQQKIAYILSNVDSLINQTQKIIEHTQELKKELMQKLLIRGIGHKKFKKVKWLFEKEIEIPEDWEVQSLDSITRLLTNGFVGKATDHYTESENGVPYIQGYNVEKNGFNFHGMKHVTQQFNEQHQKSRLHLGDLLTIQTGDIGITTIVPHELVGANCHALIISRFKEQIADPYYYCQYFNSNHCQRIFKTIEIGTTLKHLNGGDMKKLQLLCPPLSEQQKIASILSNVDSQIQKQQEYKSKLESLKKGLMQKMLTGQIRVKI